MQDFQDLPPYQSATFPPCEMHALIQLSRSDRRGVASSLFVSDLALVSQGIYQLLFHLDILMTDKD
jgi:hypothetical protein